MDNDKPVGKPYEGPSGVGRDSTWLTAEDLVEGRDAEVQIKRVVLYPRVKFQGGRTRDNMIGLEFVGKARVLGLNATNRRALNTMFGNITKAWTGQKIKLYVAETQLAGETVKCVRIRNTGSRVASAAEQFLHDDEPVAVGGAVEGDHASTAQAPPEAASPTVELQNWQDAFNKTCDEMDVSKLEKDALIEKHGGDFEAACEELLGGSR